MLSPLPPFLDLRTATLPATFAGALQGYRHHTDHGAGWRFVHHKRWYYVGASTADVYVGAAIVDLGYAGKGFVYVFDRAAKRFVAHASILVPAGPWLRLAHQDDGRGSASLHAPRVALALSRTVDGHVTFSAHTKDLRLRLFLSATEAQAFASATALAGGGTNLTEKTLAMQTSGEIHAGGKTYPLNGAGGVDFTDGLLPRHTTWRWAFFNQGRVGLNLVQDWNGAAECVLSAHGQLEHLGEAVIDFDRDAPEKPWHVSTRCGRIDLRFEPLAVHRESQDLKLVRSRFIQPVGIFSGRAGDHTIAGALGVCEDQDVLW